MQNPHQPSATYYISTQPYMKRDLENKTLKSNRNTCNLTILRIAYLQTILVGQPQFILFCHLHRLLLSQSSPLSSVQPPVDRKETSRFYQYAVSVLREYFHRIQVYEGNKKNTTSHGFCMKEEKDQSIISLFCKQSVWKILYNICHCWDVTSILHTILMHKY